MSDTAIPEAAPRRVRRQRLGMRPGLEPYYAIVEHTPTRLVLRSQARANARVGYIFMARGAVLGLLALFGFCAGYFALVQNGADALGAVVLATLCGGVLGGLGFAGLVGGWAIASTTNSITVDADTRTIRFAQSSHVLHRARERTQTLYFDQIARLRLRSITFLPPGFLRRKRQIVALEMVTDEQYAWLVDSAAERIALQSTAAALSEVLGLEVQPEMEPGERSQ